jgi:hypothetical protein
MRGAQLNVRGSGSEQYPPTMMLALLIYAYTTGLFSSRRIERATYESVAVRYLCANYHPDHDTVAKFRRENEALFRSCFTQVLLLAREAGVLRWKGECGWDGWREPVQRGARRRKRPSRTGISAESFAKAETADARNATLEGRTAGRVRRSRATPAQTVGSQSPFCPAGSGARPSARSKGVVAERHGQCRAGVVVWAGAEVARCRV